MAPAAAEEPGAAGGPAGRPACLPAFPPSRPYGPHLRRHSWAGPGGDGSARKAGESHREAEGKWKPPAARRIGVGWEVGPGGC